ncbi:DUF3558 domain-containing protein [Rhodococcus oryzae]|uniref:DUF3558 domain-containing protein n=1 Tax=Rhodococcus oryzae TaxID=2571143 RepID=UPI0037BCDA2D
MGPLVRLSRVGRYRSAGSGECRVRVRTRGLVALGAACGALVLAGCGSETVAGEAEAVGTGAGEPVFSPCDDIPDDALRAAGVDPSTESRDIIGVKQPGWNVCGWHGDGPSLSVFATTHTLDEVRANKQNTEFAPVELRDRAAFSYREQSDRERRSCDVAVESHEGAILVSVVYLGVDPVVEEPCSVAVRTTHQLVENFPA